MSAFALNYVACPDLQTDLDNIYSSAAVLRREFHPYLNFLTSDLNRSSFLVDNIRGRGKKRVIEYLYTPRLTLDDVSTTVSYNCTTTNEAGQLSSECEVDTSTGAEVKEKIDLLSIADICEDNPMWVAKRIQAMIDGVKLQIENSLLQQAAAGVGGFSDQDTEGVAAGVKSVETTKTNDPNPDALREIRFTARDAGFPGVYSFGGAPITKYFDTVANGCCNDDGIDFDSFFGTSGIVHSYSPYLETYFGADEFLVTVPGSAQFAWFNLYDGPEGTNVINDASNIARTIVDPETGIPFDFWMEKECGTEWVMGVGLPFKLCVMPSDYFGLNDRLSGVNGLWNFKVDNT